MDVRDTYNRRYYVVRSRCGSRIVHATSAAHARQLAGGGWFVRHATFNDLIDHALEQQENAA